MNVYDLMENPQLHDGMRLVAGKKGLSHEIRWIYFADCTQCLSDDYNIADFVHGGELVIITNESLTGSDQTVIEMIDILSTKDIAALVISTGQISEKVASYCENKDLPLFDLSFDLHLIDLSQIVCRSIIEEEVDYNARERILSSVLFEEDRDMELIISRALTFGIDLKRKHRAMVVQLYPTSNRRKEKTSTSWETSQSCIESRFRMEGIKDFLILSQSNRIVILLAEDEFHKEKVERVLNGVISKLEKNEHISAKAGIGSPYEYAEDFSNSYLEANRVLEILDAQHKPDQQIFYYDNLGIYSILAQVSNTRFLDEYVNKTIGKLLESDRILEGSLCETLQMYLETNCNANAAAEALYIHRNTMHYRMDKIKKLLGMELNKMDEFLELKLAFAILRYRNSDKR